MAYEVRNREENGWEVVRTDGLPNAQDSFATLEQAKQCALFSLQLDIYEIEEIRDDLDDNRRAIMALTENDISAAEPEEN